MKSFAGSVRGLVAITVGAFALLLIQPLFAAADAGPGQDEFSIEPEPLPNLISYAAEQKIPLTGLTFDDSPSPYPNRGDSVTFLITLRDDAPPEQWLATLTLASVTSSERETHKNRSDTVNTSTGRTFKYDFSPTAIEVRMIGPFREPKKGAAADHKVIKPHVARAIVDGSALKIGMFAYCESAIDIAQRIHAAGLKSLRYTGGSKPPSDDWKKQSLEDANKVHLTEDEERLSFSIYFALRSFFEAANSIPESHDLIYDVIEKPSVLSIAKHMGLWTDFGYGWTEVVRIPSSGGPLYNFPLSLSLNGNLALTSWLLVTPPTPPLQVSAGIIGIRLFNPKNPKKNLYIRALCSQRGTTPLGTPAGN